MANTLKPKRSATAAKVPTTTDLASGELGVNMADRKIYIHNGSVVVQVGAGLLSALGDVDMTGIATGSLISWDGTKFVPSSPSGSGTVTSIATGAGLTGGPITTTGTIALATSGVTAGTYTKITVDTYGRATVGASLASGDVTTALGFSPSDKAGDTFTGNVTVPRLFATGLSTSWGTTNGVNTGGVNITMGTSNNATWLISGTSGTTFMAGIQVYDGGVGSTPQMRIYEGTNFVSFSANILSAQNITANGTLSVRASGDMRLWDADTSNYVGFRSPSVVNSSFTWALPATDGTSAQALTTNGTGTLGWTTFLTGNQSISLSGDATGSGATSIAVTLANSGVTAGTYTKVTVDAKGRVTVGASLASADLPTYTGTLTSAQITTGLGFTPYNATNPNGYITSSALSSYLPLAGGTLTGILDVNSSAAAPSGGTSLTLGKGVGYKYIQSWGSEPLNLNPLGNAVQITGNQVLHAGNYTSYAQATLVSGTNIKTINGNSILGSGDIVISGGAGGASTDEIIALTLALG